MEVITLKLEVYVNGAWSDITADTSASTPLSCSWGIGGNSALDRVAETGQLTFSLKNETGKFTPGGATVLTGWKKGVSAKLTLTHESIDYIRFIGFVDMLRIDAGTSGNRKVHVTCLDWLGYSMRNPINSPAIQQSVTADVGITSLLTGMPIQPLSTNLDVGTNTFETIFDNATIKTYTSSEFHKLVMSEMGYLYLTKPKATGEQLVFENSNARPTSTPIKQVIDTTETGFLLKEDGDLLLQENGDNLIIESYDLLDVHIDNTMLVDGGMDVTYGEHLINRISVTAYPKRIETESTLVYELENPIPINAGQSVSIRVQYTDPSNKRLIAALPPEDDGATKSLIHFDGEDFSRLLFDDTGRVWIPEDVQLVTNTVKFGKSSGYLDGTGSYFYTSSSEDFNFGSGDFTVEWWEYRFASTSGACSSKRDYSTSFSPFTLGRSDGASLLIDMSSNGASNDIANGKTLGAITLNVWCHFRVCRSGNNFYAFKDGVLTDSWTSSSALNSSTAVMSFGRNSSTYITACIDEMRIIKGYAVSTSGFALPTEPFALSGAYFTSFTNSDSTGTDLKGDFTVEGVYGGVGADITVTNGGTSDGYLNTLRIFSFGVISDSPITDIQENTESINEYGYQDASIDMPYQQNTYFGKEKAALIVEEEEQPRISINKVRMNANSDSLRALAFLNVDVGDLVEITEDQIEKHSTFFVQNVSFDCTPASEGVIINYAWGVREFQSVLSPIAVEFFGDTTNANVDFGIVPEVNSDDVTRMIVSAWVYLDTFVPVQNIDILRIGEGGQYYYVYISSNGSIRTSRKFTTYSVHGTASSTITTGAWVHVFIDYSFSDGLNVPVMYKNGVSQSITFTSSSSGSPYTLELNKLTVGYNLDGKLKDIRIYDANQLPISIATLVAGLYAEGGNGTGYSDGLLFHGFFVNEIDLDDYTDLELTEDNKLLDNAQRAIGTAVTFSGTDSPTTRII